MSDLPPHDPEDLADAGEDLTAAEYALGVLDREARAAAEARAERDPAFAREILAWVVRLAPWIEAIPSAEPSPELWVRIEMAIGRAVRAPSSPAPAQPVYPPPANDHVPRGLMLWRAWALTASAVAAAALVFIAVRPGLTPSGGHGPSLLGPSLLAPSLLASVGKAGDHTLVANLRLTAGSTSAVTVAYDPVHATLYAAPDAEFSIPQSRSAQLWLIPGDGKPRPMGLIDPSKPATMPMPEKFRTLARADVSLALSIEPVGGSTTGLPTGPVVAAGKFVQL